MLIRILLLGLGGLLAMFVAIETTPAVASTHQVLLDDRAVSLFTGPSLSLFGAARTTQELSTR